MKSHFNRIILTIIFGGICITSFGQFRDKKEVKKEALISSDARVSLTNKHGLIQINSWEKDSIKIRIEILGSSKNLEKLEDMMNRTSIISHVNKEYVDISTRIDESIISQEWKNIKNIAGYSGEQIRVNYYISVPRTCRFKIDHAFGNLYMNDHQGALDIRMDHGDLRAGNLDKLDFAGLTFVNAYIKSVQNSSIVSSFGDLDLKRAVYLKLESKGSTIEIKELSRLQMISTRDRVEIEQLDEATITSSLSKFEIGRLQKNLDISIKYGKLRIEHIENTCTLISIQTNRSTSDLYFDPACSFVLDGFGDELELVIQPGLGNISNGNSSIQGIIGTNKSSTNKIYIKGDHSTISLNKM